MKKIVSFLLVFSLVFYSISFSSDSTETSNSDKIIPITLVIASVFVVAAFISVALKNKEEEQSFQNYMDNQLYVSTLEDFILQLGVPTNKYVTDRYIILDWVQNKRASTRSYSVINLNNPIDINPFVSSTTSVSVLHSIKLSLRFDKITKLLIDWKYITQ